MPNLEAVDSKINFTERKRTTQEKRPPDGHTHTSRTREDLYWALLTIVNPADRLRAIMRPPVLGKGWESACANPDRCLSNTSNSALANVA